jgi:two-component system alkaline phosphatase synthesis response regulator PhoP
MPDAGRNAEQPLPETSDSSPNLKDVILVVDDEPALRDAVAYSLRRDGYEVVVAQDGPAAIAAARLHRPDLILLDIMLPGMDGFEVCREIRAESTVPIVMLSARGETVDRVIGLEIGADDYLTKPFAMRELLARVRANLRRTRMALESVSAQAPPPETSKGPMQIVAGDLAIDWSRRRAMLGGQEIVLKPKEFDLLYYLARFPGLVLSRDALLREVWGYDYPVDTRTVDVHIRWLRQKLEPDPANPKRIETVRGYGYRFVAEPAD